MSGQAAGFDWKPGQGLGHYDGLEYLDNDEIPEQFVVTRNAEHYTAWRIQYYSDDFAESQLLGYIPVVANMTELCAILECMVQAVKVGEQRGMNSLAYGLRRLLRIPEQD